MLFFFFSSRKIYSLLYERLESVEKDSYFGDKVQSRFPKPKSYMRVTLVTVSH